MNNVFETIGTADLEKALDDIKNKIDIQNKLMLIQQMYDVDLINEEQYKKQLMNAAEKIL
jgi:hypothetical protein